MTREECAAALYDLIVNRGRWKGKKSPYYFSEGTYESLPEWMQELWLAKADEFAAQNTFTFVEA